MDRLIEILHMSVSLTDVGGIQQASKSVQLSEVSVKELN
jgi:hypothetical protein